MRPTAYILLALSLVLALSGALVFRSPNPSTSEVDGAHAGPWTVSTPMIVMLASAAGVAAIAWVLLRFGGKGYTTTESSTTRR